MSDFINLSISELDINFVSDSTASDDIIIEYTENE